MRWYVVRSAMLVAGSIQMPINALPLLLDICLNCEVRQKSCPDVLDEFRDDQVNQDVQKA